MGAPEEVPLPPATSPSLVLAHPTPNEKRRTWTLTQPEWGTALTVDEYLHREEYLTTVPLARHGGITHWILTIRSMPEDERPILSSCESLRKRALFTTPQGEVSEGIAHGVGSVYTDPAYRGKGYASRLLAMVRDELGSHQGPPIQSSSTSPYSLPPVAFSFLFSDIGKKFYASRGWVPHRSTHLSFTPLPTDAATNGSTPPHATPLGYHDLAELCTRDETLLRQRLAARRSPPSSCTPPDPSQPLTYVALPPDLDTMLWHLMREDFITTRVFGSTPAVRGAVFGRRGKRVWAIWTRTYQAPPPNTASNTLYILRLVVEDESAGDDYLAEGLRAVIDYARREASDWGTSKVQLWNPDTNVEALMRKAALKFDVVEREMDSIPSLLWYGDAPQGSVVWVACEKHTWC
ncbi:hypothetical protein VUR80DRAFT_1693 [Thermomyces stellatus]